MLGVLLLLVLLAVVVATTVGVGKLVWDWRPPFGERLVKGAGVLFAALTTYACGDLTTGAWFHVSPEEAESEFEAVLGFDVPPIMRVVNAGDLGWAPTDGPQYGYTAEFYTAGFRAFMRRWPSVSDSLGWTTVDEAEHITHEFSVWPAHRRVRYFHADE